MKISLNWLRELCPTDLSAEELARKLTFAGFEVESVEQQTLGPQADVVAARIVSTEPIPGTELPFTSFTFASVTG